MHLHDHYKELFALALSGQIAQGERKELEHHLHSCAECRSEMSDFAQIATHFPGIADEHEPLAVPEGLTERVMARARSEGIPLSAIRKPQAVRYRPKPSRAVPFAIVAILAGVCTYSIVRAIQLSPTGIFGSLSSRPRPMPVVPPSSVPVHDRALEENADLRGQIQRLTTDLAVLSARVKSDQAQLKAAESDKRALGARLSDAEASEAGLRQGVTDRETEVAQLKSELEESQATKEARGIALRVDENEMKALREQMAKLDTKLQESEHLSSAANQARDLIVARNLHIVDVDDTDENGKRRRPFGRIFYAEGQELVFYAYDLNDPRKLNAKINFQVWGSREGDNTLVKSLGIFHADDAKDGRWVLRFDDPDVLAQINCVFVTAESDKKPVTHPTGRQILFASLGKSNHP